MPPMKWKRPTLRGMHAVSRKLLMIPAQGGRFGLQAHVGLPITGREARLLQRRRMSHREGGGVLMELLGLQHRARPPPRPDFEVHRAQDGTTWARC